MKYPDNERILIVRPCLKAICLGVRSASKLLSVLLYRARNCKEDETTFTFTCTQVDLANDLCEELTTKQLHDMAIPVLQLLGYLDVNGSGFRHTYTVHLDKVQEALACYRDTKKLEEVLISFIREELEEVPMELEEVPIQLEEVLKQLELVLKTIGKSSNSKRGRKPRPQAALEANSENTENQRDNIDSLDTKRDSGAFAPSDFLPPEEDFSEEDEAPTVRMPAIKLNGASNGSTHTELSSGRDRGNTGDGGILRAAGRSMGQAERTALDTTAGSQALQVQSQTQEITQQTPGPGALPPSAEPPQFGGSHGITSDQASLSVSVAPPPAQADFPPAGSNPVHVAPTAQATGERGKPEKPVQQALSTGAEGNVAQERTQEKETAKQKKARLERRRDEIIALHCQLLGRNVVRSKDELEGARLMAEAGSTDAEITITYNRYKKDKFWGHQLTLKNIAKLLDTTVANDTSVPAKASPRARPKPEDRNISIYEIDPSWQVWQRPGEDQEWIWWQGEFWTPDEADDRGYNGGGGLYIQTQYAQGV